MNNHVQDAILLLGDSLTQGASMPHGFAQRLSYVYNRKLDVINRGLSGYNTTWSLPVFEQCLVKQPSSPSTPSTPKIQLLVIWFGANDSCLIPSPQHVPLHVFKSNLVDIIHMITSPSSPYHAPWTRVLLLTPPPVNTLKRGSDLLARDPPRQLDRDFGITKKYAETVKEIAQEEGLPVVDVWTMLWEGCGKKEEDLTKYLSDGLHVNEEAYGLIYDGIMKAISERWPEMLPENLQNVFPPWDQIDWDNPVLTKNTIL